MPPFRKPYRIAVLAPRVTFEAGDPLAAYHNEVALVLWTACIEVLRRHPGLAVYDADALPLRVRDGHFVPDHADPGSTPTDARFGPARREELMWLELARGEVSVHTVDKAGTRKQFDGDGRTLGERIDRAFAAWLGVRELGAPPMLGAVTAEDLAAVIKAIGPGLVEHAREVIAPSRQVERGPDDDIDDALDALVPTVDRPVLPTAIRTRRSTPGRQLTSRLPVPLRAVALRVLELAFGEDLSDLLLGVDPEHPTALFARWRSSSMREPDLLRRAIASAPGWAAPYAALSRGADSSALEVVAGAGMAALCRPAQREVIESAAAALRDDGRVAEAMRLVERAAELHAGDPGAAVAMLGMARSTGRIGAWLLAAEQAAARHGCSHDPALPRYPDQIEIDLRLSEALLHAGRFHAAVALRAARLDGVEVTWPTYTAELAKWRDEPRFAIWCEARAAWFGGDPVRALERYGAIELDGRDRGLDLAIVIDALVATGRESEAPLAWALFGLGRELATPVSRLAAARALMAAGEWRRGLEEMWRVELGEPGRDDHVALAHLGVLLSTMPLEVAEAALAERVAGGAFSLARRMARDVADFVPGAAKNEVVMRALGKPIDLQLDHGAFAAFSCRGAARQVIDALFAELEPEVERVERPVTRGRRPTRRVAKVERPVTVVIDPKVGADRLVDRWLDAVYVDIGEDPPTRDPDHAASPALARAGIYVAAQALGRYLVATTAVPSVTAGALRTVAAEALALVRRHRRALRDDDVRAFLGVIDPVLRRIDRWVGASWLALVERSCGIDERTGGDLAGFAQETSRVAARLIGPEEAAVLAASVARVHRERRDGWAAACSAQAARLSRYTGCDGLVEWADATVAELADGTIEVDDAIDTLQTAAYLAEGVSGSPAIQLARVLLDAGRADPATIALQTGLGATRQGDERARVIEELVVGRVDRWPAEAAPPAPDRALVETREALQNKDPASAERLGRWAIAFDPEAVEAHRSLGLACAQQGNIVDALHHLARGTRGQATQILAGVLFQLGKLPQALAVLDHASRWYRRAEQWLGFGGIADAAADHVRSERAYARAFELDPDALDAIQLDAYARACLALDDREHAAELARRAIERNTQPGAAAALQSTLDRATGGPGATAVDPAGAPARDPAFVALDRGDFATAIAALDALDAETRARPRGRDWQALRAAIAAVRHRSSGEMVGVTHRARSAAAAVLAETTGSFERGPVLCRIAALAIREQAELARDPMPRLGDSTRAVEPAPPVPTDHVMVSGSKVSRLGEYVALLRDLAALGPGEALEQFGLDHEAYLEVGRAWGAAIDANPELAAAVSAALARR